MMGLTAGFSSRCSMPDCLRYIDGHCMAVPVRHAVYILVSGRPSSCPSGQDLLPSPRLLVWTHWGSSSLKLFHTTSGQSAVVTNGDSCPTFTAPNAVSLLRSSAS
jgi:hypothetical protein